MDRRNSHDEEPSRSLPNPDVFDDDYEVDPNEDDFMPSVSDGFRPIPTNETERRGHQNHDHDLDDMPQRSKSISKGNESDLRRMATRNSIAKGQDMTPPDGRPSFTRAPDSRTGLSHRVSVSSAGSFATTSNSENPFEPGTGPSHPYGMYPQHTMARPPSVATTSTDRQPHRSMSLQRPTHPYAMYSQSGLVDEEPLDEPTRPSVPQMQSAIPVGFPGLNAGYHRVLGPDGEEQDIIGPDGHTEQLPPYSRHPEEGPTKASMAAQASASRVIPAPIQVADPDDPFMTPASPTSPLSSASFSAPALPAPAPLLPSVTPARLPPQRPETQTGGTASVTSAQNNMVPAEPSDSSSASLLATESSFSEKAEAIPSKISWRKRKLWGKVPMGIVVIVLVLFVIFAIALGTAIGTVIAKKNKEQDHRPHYEHPQSQVSGPNGTMFGAVPIATPSGLTPLPTGAFALPLGIPQESNPGCLTQANQYSAWSCKLTFAPLIITVNTTDDGSQYLSVAQGRSIPNGALLYGEQTPIMNMQSMQLVVDMDYKAFGPSWHFAARYDKLVILRQEELSASGGFSRRRDDKGFRQRFQVRPGDRPWFCFWNSTYIEGYVYSQDNSSAASVTSFPTDWPTSTSGPTSLNTAATGVAAIMAASALSSPSSTTTSRVAGATVTSGPTVRREAQADPGAPVRMPPYPRIVKLEERRVPGSPQPYCQQMILLDDGQMTTPTNGNDGPTRIWLQESAPSYEEYFNAQSSGTPGPRRDTLQKRNDPADSCHCQWMFQ